MESKILGFEIWNPNNDWNSESHQNPRLLGNNKLLLLYQECDKQEVNNWIFLRNSTTTQHYI